MSTTPRASRRHVLAAAATAAIVGAAAPRTASASTDDLPPAAERTVTIASYNIHHGADHQDVLNLALIAEEITRSGASVVGLQEVDNHWGIRSDFQDQAAELAAQLGMHVVYGANLDLPPAEGQTHNRQYGTAILSKYPIRAWSNTLLPNHPGGEQRGLLQATIKVRGTTFTFMNTHLTHQSADGRRAQSEAINVQIAASPYPVVIVGDFNATPDKPEYATFTAEVDDVWTTVGEGPGYTYPVETPNARIDYVFASSSIKPVSMRVDQTDASDHLPIVATLVLPHPSAG